MRTPCTGLTLSCAELADRLGGSLENCPGDRPISEVKPLEEAQGSALSFLANPKYRAQAITSAAGIVLVDSRTDLGDRPQLVMPNPYWGFAQAIGWFHADPTPEWSTQPVHPTGDRSRLPHRPRRHHWGQDGARCGHLHPSRGPHCR